MEMFQVSGYRFFGLMATISRFEDIEAWQVARALNRKVYEWTRNEPFSRDFSLVDQINRSSGSVMDNIAEGFERDGTKEFRQFLSIAKASCGEVRSQLYRALDRSYISKEDFDSGIEMCSRTSGKIMNFITYLNKCEHAGSKFKSGTSRAN